LLLYDLKAGMNPRRVRIFLAEKGVTVPKVEVDMTTGENKRPEYLAKNPLGRMPLLELDDGTLIAESVAICRYFQSLYPEPPLFGKGAVEIAKVEMWNRRMELEIMRPIGEAFEHLSPFWVGRRSQVAEYGNLAREVAAERMAWLDRELATRPYIAGENYTVADITAQAAFVLGKNTGTPIPDELTHLRRWFAQVSARPSARA
jgi:glutathione S-transferase